MLTVAKIEIYMRFDGDIDSWTLAGADASDSGVTEADWYLIDELRQQLTAAATGRASRRFLDALEERLADSAADPSALALLHQLVAKKNDAA